MRITIKTLLAATIFAVSTTAQAQIDTTTGPIDEAKGDDFSVSVGAGIAFGPRSLGSEDIRVLPIPAIDIRYGPVFLNMNGLGINLIDDPASGWLAGVSAFVRPERDERDDPVRLRGLGDINAAPQVRGFVAKRFGSFIAKAAIAHDFGGTDGTTLDLDIAAQVPLTDSVSLFAGPSMSIADNKFARGFFGVTSAQALLGNRDAYAIDAGIYQVGLNAGSTWQLSDDWSARAFASFRYLTGDAGRSPVVDRREQPGAGLVIVRRF